MTTEFGRLHRDWIDSTDDRVSLALTMVLLGQGTVADVRACGLDGDLRDLARAAKALPELSIAITPEGFRCDVPASVLEELLTRIAVRWADLSRQAIGVLCGRGDYRRVAKVVVTIADAVDVRPVVFRHAFDLLNVGETELVESLVFDEAFGAPEWLRDALSAVEGILWSGFRGYRDQARRARGVQGSLMDAIAEARDHDADRVPMAQAWSLLDLYASWGEEIPVASALPVEPIDDGDPLLRCLWTLRRSRQLMALGHLDGARRLVDGARELVARDSVLGAHLDLDRFLCRILDGGPIDPADLAGLRGASRFATSQRLDLLAFSIDGYLAAALAYTGVDHCGHKMERLMDRSALHPDPFLRAALAIGCACDAFRRHSFYAALSYVRDLAGELAYTGATDLTCCAYGLEALCLGAVGEEPSPMPAPGEGRPSVLGFLPLAKTIYGATQEIFDLARELDVEGAAVIAEGSEPSYVANVLADLALGGAWPQAKTLRGLLPAAWRETPRNPLCDGSGAEGSTASRPSLRLVGGKDGGAPLPRVHLVPSVLPKLTLRMLGRFEVWVGERKVVDESWRRKAGKTVLQALIVAPGHAVARVDLCDIIWPDRDYLSSRNSLYSILSSTREALDCPKDQPSYLICEKGYVSLNEKLSECDVDLFESRCREVLSRQGDAPWRLSICRDLGQLYNGGLYVPTQDVRGEFQARARALESLYVDALVEAADLSLKEGLAKEALWFSNDALGYEPLREDVVAGRLRALAADGRGHDLEQAYQRYCDGLNDGLFMTPSPRMRSLYADLSGYVREEGTPRDESLRAYEQSLGNVA